MKDFYSTEDSLPSVNKNGLKLDHYEPGKTLRDKTLQQSNLQKMQFYNNIQFPKKEEIKCQVNNRSKRILSFSCPSDDTCDLLEKQNTQQNNLIQCNKLSLNTTDQKPKKIQRNIIHEKSQTENTDSRKYKLQLKDKYSDQLNTYYNKKNFVQHMQGQKVSLDIYHNPEDEIQLKKNQSIQIENSDLNIINNKERVLYPNFDQISPLEYRGISSSLNSSIIQKQYSKGRDKFSLRSEIQQIGNMFVYKSELSSSKLPYLKDSFHEIDNNGLRNSLIAISKSTLQQTQKNHRTTSIRRQSNFDQEFFSNSQKQINSAQSNDSDQFNIIQKKLNCSDRKLAVLKVLKNKIKNRQNSLPATQLMIINSRNSQNEIQDQQNMNQNNSQIFQTQIEQQTDEQPEKKYQSSLAYLKDSLIEDKNQLSRLLMKQQPLKLHEFRNQSQIIFQQVSPSKNKQENEYQSNYQRKRVNTQHSKQNILQNLEKQIDNKSLIIKKSSFDSQFIYPIITQRPSQQNTKQNSPFKKENLSPIHFLKNDYDKDEGILQSCQQYIAKLFKKREHNLKKKSALKNMDYQVAENSNLQLKQKKVKQDKILNDLQNLEKTYEDNFNKDFEQLQKYYDEKYLQNSQADNSKGVNEQKCKSPKIKEKSPERNKLQSVQQSQNEEFLYQNIKKVKIKKKSTYQNWELDSAQNFQDLKPWNDLEQNKTSLSFFHKTIFDPDQEKNIRNSKKLH
ncbi:hypothetical protein ABPG74_012579 [Tetrahymena malaccensis]